MEDVTLLTCPKCQCKNWQDVPNVVDQVRTQFRCSRCSYTVTLGACSKCRAKAWKMVSGIREGGPHRPVYRLRCDNCSRIIGVVIDR